MLVFGRLSTLTLVLISASPMSGSAQPKSTTVKLDAEKLVRQLGDSSFAKRDAAVKALIGMGATAASAVHAGFRDADLETKRRCEALWPKLWAAELARSDAERLAGYSRPSWDRFKKMVGDDAGSRTLFVEMLADLRTFGFLDDTSRRRIHREATEWLAKQPPSKPAVATPESWPRRAVNFEKQNGAAWGKPVHGLQAGIRVTQGAGVHRQMELTVMIGNVGPKEMEFIHLKPMNFTGTSVNGKVSARGTPIMNQLSLVGGVQMIRV